ncbi:thioesterase family protein [Nocardia yunnanensis]|uniref:Thioesterase family protein n=1 Tax=Nocardia yunnanensis TaxID=2382165 RepID=A0A386ZMS2_9NOCA|nr:acyl-CoA thioesterase domain-containing protein [Nocardia yunnanensis]AYF77875.1 thioesterase family protein [Nocardia yunnanensis]
MTAFFTVENGRYTATQMAVSAWSDAQLAGTAVCGLLAHRLETHNPGPGFVPARFTVDLFSPVRSEPIEVHSSIARDGRRIRVADASIVQDGQVRARATVNFLAAAAEPPGQLWRPDRGELPIPDEPLDGPYGNPPLFKSGDLDWTHDFASGVNALRKAAWHNVPAIVSGLEPTPFERAAFVADCANLVCNWGTGGVGYINSDVTLSLSRLPEGRELGLLAQDHVSAAGIGIATALLYDRTGPLGLCTITALANAMRQVDMAEFAASRSIPTGS